MSSVLSLDTNNNEQITHKIKLDEIDIIIETIARTWKRVMTKVFFIEKEEMDKERILKSKHIITLTCSKEMICNSTLMSTSSHAHFYHSKLIHLLLFLYESFLSLSIYLFIYFFKVSLNFASIYLFSFSSPDLWSRYIFLRYGKFKILSRGKFNWIYV